MPDQNLVTMAPYPSSARMVTFALRRCVSVKSLLLVSAVSMCVLFLGNFHIGDSLFRQSLADKSLFFKETPLKAGNSPEQKCFLPKLVVDDPVMRKFFRLPAPVKCPVDPDWVYVENGTLRFSKDAIKSHGAFSCDLYQMRRGANDDTIVWTGKILGVKDGWRLGSDVFKVSCVTPPGAPPKNYTDVHLGVAPNPAVDRRFAEVRPPANGLSGLSLLVLGFDSMSRMSWLRRMNATRDYFVTRLGGIELEGYNIMGDGTPAALFPMLTGYHETEMPEARRKFKGARPVDDYPWIWKDFAKAGYMTSWADAEIFMAPFNMRLLGFKNPPTDYYMRPYYLAIESMKKFKKHAPDCRGSIPKHKIWLDWVRDLFYMYGNKPKFMFHFYATLSHQDNNDLIKADKDLKLLLEDLEARGYLNQTIVVLLGDHGARFAKYRETWPGKLEERLPYVAFRFPPWFHQKYSQLVRNFRTNAGRLTTALDLHETFKDILRFDGAGVGNLNHRGISLFKEIPVERECSHANVSNHWCACLNWEVLPLTDETALRATMFAVDTINNYTSGYRDVCAELSLGSLTMASKIAAHEDMVKFKQSSDVHGRVADLTESNSTAVVLYQLTFHTEPGHGHFEVTVSHSLMNDTLSVSEREISRINQYGTDSSCILEKNRQLRQYCYCSKKSET